MKEKYRTLTFKNLHSGESICLHSDLLGIYQIKNVRTALVALDQLRSLGFKVSAEIVEEGISNIVAQTSLLGRWQSLGENPKIICDTGHNVAGVKEILKQINSLDYEKLHMVIGMVDDKEIDEVLNLLPKNASYYFTRASIPRALDEGVLKEKADSFNLKGETYPCVSDALEAAKLAAGFEDLVFVGGSTFVVAEVV